MVARLALAAALLLPAAAVAQERLAVVSLAAPADLRFMGKSLADGVAVQAQRQRGLTVLGPEEVERKLGKDAGRALSACGASAPCLASLSRRLEVDRVVGGSLDRSGDTYRVALVHADARSGEVLASWEKQVPVASRKLASEVQAAAPPLLRGKASAPALRPR